MSQHHKNARENAPIWVKENRRPTKDELAAKHAADGGPPAGGDANSSLNSLGDDDVPDFETVVVKRYHTHD